MKPDTLPNYNRSKAGMKITHIGAKNCVTGSCHLVQTHPAPVIFLYWNPPMETETIPAEKTDLTRWKNCSIKPSPWPLVYDAAHEPTPNEDRYFTPSITITQQRKPDPMFSGEGYSPYISVMSLRN